MVRAGRSRHAQRSTLRLLRGGSCLRTSRLPGKLRIRRGRSLQEGSCENSMRSFVPSVKWTPFENSGAPLTKMAWSPYPAVDGGGRFGTFPTATHSQQRRYSRRNAMFGLAERIAYAMHQIAMLSPSG